jgi:N6-adenosine-specific RNA methylase IME4
LFGTRGKLRTGSTGRRQTNVIVTQKRAHSVKPDELYNIIEQCSPGPYIELFARFKRKGWSRWGDEADLNGKQIKVHPTYRGNGTVNGISIPRRKQAKLKHFLD